MKQSTKSVANRMQKSLFLDEDFQILETFAVYVRRTQTLHSKIEKINSGKKEHGESAKQSTVGIRWWSPTQLLTCRHMA